MSTISDRIASAIAYLHADAQTQTLTISADVLRKMARGMAIARTLNGGGYVAGIVADGAFLPPSGGPRKATVTVRAPANEDETVRLLAALREAVDHQHPCGSAYDPAMAPAWNAYRALREELAQ